MDSIKKLRDLLVNDNGFAFDQASGHTYTISATGMDVLRWLKESVREDELPDRMAAEYDVDRDKAERDVTAFLDALRRYGLLRARAEGAS